jgi:hypothetical protein
MVPSLSSRGPRAACVPSARRTNRALSTKPSGSCRLRAAGATRRFSRAPSRRSIPRRASSSSRRSPSRSADRSRARASSRRARPTATGTGGIRGATRDGDALLVRVDGAEGRGVVATAPAFGRVVVPADKGGVVHVPLAADFSGRVALELDPVDPWPEDDAAAFDVAPGRRIAVAVVSAGETPALDAALRASGLVDARRSGRVEPARWREAAAGFDVVVLVGRDEESPLPAGRYLLVDAAAPGLPLARVEGPAKARATRRAGEARWLATLDPEEWEIRKASVFAATAGADVLVEGDRGPLFVRLRRGDVDAFALTVPPTEAASTLPLLPAFPLMIRGLLEELAPAAVSPTVVAVDPAGLRPPFSEAPEPAEAREAAAGPPARPGPPIRSSLRAALFAALLVLLVVEWWLYHLGATD